MKNYLALLLVVSLLAACKNDTKNNTVLDDTVNDEIAYASFGKKIVADDALSTKLMAEQYKNMKIGDTVDTKMSGKINEVCSSKGCWMKLDLGNEEEVMVIFKDYGFFMPLDANGEVIINGKAFVTETSVEELRHFAEDSGKSKTEIDAITSPKKAYIFEADGVLLKE